MKKLHIMLMIVTQVFFAQAQNKPIKQWNLAKKTIHLGVYTNGQIINNYDTLGNNIGKYRHLAFFSQLGYVVSPKWIVNVNFLYGSIWGNLTPNFNYYGIGVGTRYIFLPKTAKQDTITSAQSRAAYLLSKLYQERIKFFVEPYYYLTNVRYSSLGHTHLNRLENSMFGLGVGMYLKVTHYLAIDYTWRVLYSPSVTFDKFSQIRPTIGLNCFLFSKQDAKEKH